jgi:CubicO group peptidase (beta-lactamase class C family)
MRHWLAVAAVFVAATCQAAELDRTKLSAVRAKMEKFVEDQHVAGVVTVIGTSKGVDGVEAVGKLRLDGDAMPKDAVFRIASMTKPMTAVAVMILADEGKLKVDDPVEKHLPEFKGQWLIDKAEKDKLTLKKPARAITLLDLLTHTSGLAPYPSGLGNVYQKRDRSLAETTLAVSQTALLFEPGSRWAYCNSGIDVLGRVIEVVSGESYEDFMRKRIFEPLGMKDTSFKPSKELLKRAAGLYDRKGDKLVAVKDNLLGSTEKSRHPIPAGGLYSTGADVARFYRMMLNEGSLDGKKILKPETVKEMTKVHTGDLKSGFTNGMGFGLGFAVVRKLEGATEHLSERSFGHGGAFGTQSWADPKRDLFVILLIQRVGLPNADASDMRKAVQKAAVEAIKR